jgi:hypothetical protein
MKWLLVVVAFNLAVALSGCAKGESLPDTPVLRAVRLLSASQSFHLTVQTSQSDVDALAPTHWEVEFEFREGYVVMMYLPQRPGGCKPGRDPLDCRVVEGKWPDRPGSDRPATGPATAPYPEFLLVALEEATFAADTGTDAGEQGILHTGTFNPVTARLRTLAKVFGDDFLSGHGIDCSGNITESNPSSGFVANGAECSMIPFDAYQAYEREIRHYDAKPASIEVWIRDGSVSKVSLVVPQDLGSFAEELNVEYRISRIVSPD